MPRTCIICGVAANSGEHIFPAALGGRRVNRGIYCGTHNNGFSDLANVLSHQLGMFNALLGVRPDRADRARVLHVTTPMGDEIIISRGSVERASTSSVSPDEQIHLQFDLGGPEALPAIGYVALTFFAHYFPDEARQAGLGPLKAFIQGQGENTFVWWESDTTTYGLPANAFEFGHTIVLTTSAATGEAMAVISLFQSLTFGIALGGVEGARDRTVVVFIDPHAEHPPADTQQRTSDTVELQIQRPDPLHMHLERMVRGGHGPELIQDLFTKIKRWKFRTDMGPVLDRLNATVALPPGERVRTIWSVLEENGLWVYSLMRYAVKEFRKRSVGQADIGPHLADLDDQITLNSNRDDLSDKAQVSFERALVALTKELNTKLSQGAIDMDYLWLLFSGGPGAHIVAQTMFKPLFARIRRLRQARYRDTPLPNFRFRGPA